VQFREEVPTAPLESFNQQSKPQKIAEMNDKVGVLLESEVTANRGATGPMSMHSQIELLDLQLSVCLVKIPMCCDSQSAEEISMSPHCTLSRPSAFFFGMCLNPQVLRDLCDIWRDVIMQELLVSSTDWAVSWIGLCSSHPASQEITIVLVVADLADRTHIKRIISMCFKELGVKAVAVLPESVAALFGTGTNIGCIVDVGHRKTSSLSSLGFLSYL
jgi:hypothetical protein